MTKRTPPQLIRSAGRCTVVFTLLMAILCGARTAQCATRTVTLVTSQGHAYEEVGNRVYNNLIGTEDLVLRTFNVGELDILNKNEAGFLDNALVVTVGTSALKYMATNHQNATVLAIFVTSYSYQAVIAELAPQRHHFFGLYIDQPLERYLRLTQLILPSAKSLSITGLKAANTVAEITESPSSNCSIHLEEVEMAADSNPIRLLDSYFARSDAFLVFPQANALDRNSAKWILYLASRHRKPVIAFSEKYVDGGALAAVFAGPSDIATETSDILSVWRETGIPDTAWGKTGDVFTVKTNLRIARFLKLKIASESQLTQNLAKESLARDCEVNER
ncbi:MAG: putative ABC transport system substrate-binding protein [Halioglobus sp.]|jgi:putative ABC transport system substrate-binding protein